MMVTRDVLKTEIDCIQDEYLDVLYRFMKSLEMPLTELRVERHRQPVMRVRKLEGIWEGLGFENIADIEASIRDIRHDAEDSLTRRLARCSM